LLFAVLLAASVLVTVPSVPAARAGAIQDLIDAAAPGDTVTVAAGTFVEDLTIDKDLTLEGAGAGVSVIQGTNEGPVVTVATTGVDLTISGLTITNGNGTDGGGITFSGGGHPRPGRGRGHRGAAEGSLSATEA